MVEGVGCAGDKPLSAQCTHIHTSWLGSVPVVLGMRVRYLVCISSYATPTEPGRKPWRGGLAAMAGLRSVGTS